MTGTTAPRLRVLIVAEHASARFGGEAALPLHYFRVLERRGYPVHLLVHARTRAELRELYGAHPRIHYVEDNALHMAMWRLGSWLPHRLAYITTGFVSRIATQLVQRRIARCLVKNKGIDVVHQPIPVSPREPSALFGLGAPVVIGPMNGNMTFPPSLQPTGAAETLLIAAARLASGAMQRLIPGKRRASVLLVANWRTREALPTDVAAEVINLVENGVDLGLFDARRLTQPESPPSIPRFVFIGRLVDWKRVDLLLQAFAAARMIQPMTLTIIGDGPERKRLAELASSLELTGADEDALEFTGWLNQSECARLLLSARALVLPSTYECGGAVVLEAMAMGRAVVATAWGGPLDYLTDQCGILLPPTSERALADGLRDAMLELAADADRAAELGRRGADEVARRHDWEIKVDTMVGIYERAVAVVSGLRSAEQGTNHPQ